VYSQQQCWEFLRELVVIQILCGLIGFLIHLGQMYRIVSSICTILQVSISAIAEFGDSGHHYKKPSSSKSVSVAKIIEIVAFVLRNRFDNNKKSF
jgi:predicted cobalt transporter CbtA